MSALAEDTFDCAGKGGGEKDSARSQSLPAGSQHLREGRNGALSDKIGWKKGKVDFDYRDRPDDVRYE